jgi:small-conductance mechanosensitive channel
MERRRVVFNIGVTYQTPADVLEAISEIVKDIITSNEDLTYDRGHFSGFGDFSLNFEFVYFVLTADYNLYMDRQQAVYLSLYRIFESKGIEFAYPTQTLFVNRNTPEQKIA